MSKTVTMYPVKAEQPNRNKSSGLQGKCFKAVRRNGTSYNVSCSFQKDPKYHHEWSNVEELFKGKAIQCGRPSTRFCSHATYYGIKGYRNTCPIAGISGTYTQPATLRLFFDLTKKGILKSTKIKEVRLSFEHRCTGVDVANGKETTVWGPNFNGGNVYPNKHALTIKIGNQKKYLDKNPPLSTNFGKTGSFVFTNVSYDDLKNGVDVIYGNNLETNPGNIYIRNLKLSVEYENGEMYLEGTQDSKSLYLSDIPSCRSKIKFTLEAGYKEGNKKMSPSKAPKILQKKIKAKTTNKNITVTYEYKNDKKTVIATLEDKTSIAKKKSVVFYIDGTNNKKRFEYTAKKIDKPSIEIAETIPKNTYNTSTTSIIVTGGCVKNIKAYGEDITTDPIYEFTEFNSSNSDNIIKSEDIDGFYEALSTKLGCGLKKVLFIVNDKKDSIYERQVKITPISYKFKITDLDNTKEITSFEAIQNKSQNQKLLLHYIKTEELISNPSFLIRNSTHGKVIDGKPTDELIDDYRWENVNKEGASTQITVGTYLAGDFSIVIEDGDLACQDTPTELKVKITPRHKQYYDEIFVRGEDSTAFNYEYLVALEGDSIKKPIYVESINLGASYEDIKLCAEKDTFNNIAGLTEVKYVNLTITNTSERDIQNLFLELNTLIYNEDDNLEVTSNEWLESGGIFYNFKENFEQFNQSYEDIVTIRNLTKDDDEVDEEDVYIQINQLAKQSEIDLKIPYGSSIEKEVFLQILLFGEPMVIYEKGFCNDDTKTFNSIPFRVYDSTLTNMTISGDTDLYSTEIVGGCPNECFLTKEGITYSIKNIDTNTLESLPEVRIINDPRLVPYKIKNKKGMIHEIEDGESTYDGISFIKNVESYRENSLKGAKINAYLKFENHDEVYLSEYTDSDGEALFFVSLPTTISGYYSIDTLLDYMSFEYDGNHYYNPSPVNTEYPGPKRNHKPSSEKRADTFITITSTPIQYHPGQVVPIKVKLTAKIKYYKNEIIFNPKITNPGDSDEITMYYRICNLKGNEGILKTVFTTQTENNNSYLLVPNEVSENIYCGVKTDLDVTTNLIKSIVEKTKINQLRITLNNRKRKNKDICVEISEQYSIEKYDIIDTQIDKGSLKIENGKIKWDIDFMNEEEIVRGYIELKAKEIGFSSLKVTSTDFQDRIEDIKFGRDSYKCDCRETIDYGE